MKTLSLMAAALLLANCVYAQHKISGETHDASEQKVIGATVLLFREADSILEATAVTDEHGLFAFENINPGSYVLNVRMFGFEKYVRRDIRIENNNAELGIIRLKSTTELKEITVRGQKPLIEIRADMLIVNVASSIVNTGSNVLEVLSRSPGITVDQSENIRMKGRPGITVMIDGKPTPLQGAELANYLKSMPAANVEKIELIANPGARYDAAGTGGIINIRTKRNQKTGWNGSLHAVYRQGVYHKANMGFNTSYGVKKWNFNANYTYVNRAGFNNLTIERYFYDKEGALGVTYRQDGGTLYPTRGHNASLAADYYVNKKTTAGVSATLDITLFDPRGDSYSRVDSSETYSFFSTSNRSNDAWYNYSVNGYLRHNIDSNGKTISADIDYARFWNDTRQRYTNKYFDQHGDFMLPDYILFGNLSGVTQIRAAKIDYSQTAFKKIKLDAGAKASLVTADNSVAFYDQSGGANVLDTTKSNHFIYKESITAAYINASQDGEKWSYQFGLRLEQTNAHGDQVTTGASFDRNYAQLFPSLAVQRHINKNNDLGITFSRRIDRPNYRQLNPFRYFLDPTNSRIGNPYLRPTLSYATELSHVYRQKYVSSLSYSIATDIITETLQADTAHPNTSINSDQNLGYQYYLGYSGSYAPRITKWWSVVANINAYYSRYVSNLSNTPLNEGTFAADANIANSFLLPGDMSAEFSAYYQTPMRWGYYEFKAMYSINMGVQKSFFEKRMTAKLSVNDIFRASSPDAVMRFNNFTEHFVAIRDTRMLSLSVSYRFGTNQQSTRRHRSGAEEEKRRAGSSG